MGSHLNLTDRQEKFLGAMGIQVWHARNDPACDSVRLDGADETLAEAVGPTRQAAAVTAETDAARSDSMRPADEVAREAVTRIEFLWWRGAAGMLIGEVASNYDERLLKDLVMALDWQLGSSSGNVTNGHFVWPQLTTTSGSPDRAMRAFMDKHLPQGASWVLVAESLFDDLSPYLPANIRCWSLPESFKTPDEKRALWQHLAK